MTRKKCSHIFYSKIALEGRLYEVTTGGSDNTKNPNERTKPPVIMQREMKDE